MARLLSLKLGERLGFKGMKLRGNIVGEIRGEKSYRTSPSKALSKEQVRRNRNTAIGTMVAVGAITAAVAGASWSRGKATKSQKGSEGGIQCQSAFNPEEPLRDRMSEYIKNLQKDITHYISQLDGKQFKVDKWTRPQGGEGISCVLEEGNVFERAGVNISIVHGQLPKPAVKQMRAEASDQLTGNGPFNFFTASISLVIHPKNPMAPTVHLNYRYFEVTDPKSPSDQVVWWFGGGSDLTPSYLFEEDAHHFHYTLHNACHQHDPTFYPEFKSWCDRYFVNTHRKESRGIGGIFFDDLDHRRGTREDLFQFVQTCGDAFLPSYLPLVERRKDMPFTAEQKTWQQLRRGRYVEFNLIHDRGTKFGLHTPNPRIESILVSLPLTARWQYDIQPSPGSPEAALVDALKHPRDWVPPHP